MPQTKILYNHSKPVVIFTNIIKWLFIPSIVLFIIFLVELLAQPELITKILGIDLTVVKRDATVLYVLDSFVIICLIIAVYYKLKKSEIHHESINDNNVKTKYYTYMAQTLDTNCLKYNCIGVTSLLLILITMYIITYYTLNTYQYQIEMLMSPHNQSNTTAQTTSIVTLLVARTALIGAFSILFLINMIRFTMSAFNQAIIFNQRKHATLYLIQATLNNQNESQGKIMEGFVAWNIQLPTAFSNQPTTERAQDYKTKQVGKLFDSIATTVEDAAKKYFK